MARVFIDGFESGGLDQWSVIVDACVANNSQAGRTGTYCLYAPSYGCVRKTIPAKSAIYMAFKFESNTSNLTRPIVKFMNGATVLGALALETATLKLIAYKGDSATELGKSASAMSVSAWKLVEIYYLPHLTDGAFQVKIDGVLEIDIDPATGNTSTAPSTTNIDTVQLGSSASLSASYFDDIVLDDAAWIGNTKIQGIVPTGAGTTTQWDPSAGSNYACVDERPPADTDYVSTNTTNEIDTYAFGDLAGAISSIKCVQIQARAAYEGAPTPTHIRLGCRVNGVDYFATDLVPASSFGLISKILETDPDTEVAWTSDGVNAAEFGIKATA